MIMVFRKNLVLEFQIFCYSAEPKYDIASIETQQSVLMRKRRCEDLLCKWTHAQASDGLLEVVGDLSNVVCLASIAQEH